MTVVSVKMTAEFRDWLALVAGADRSTVVQVLEKGAVLFARNIGVTEDAPRRTEGRPK